MPEQPKVIRKRIRSVSSTKKITRTMEMVATAKLKSAQQRVQSSGPYLDSLRSLMAEIGASGVDVSKWPHFQVRLFVAGKKGNSALRFQGFEPERVYIDQLTDRPSVDDAEYFLNELATPFLENEVDEVLIVYPHWESLGRQPPTVLRFLPIAPEGTSAASGPPPLFEPSAEEILDRLLPLYGRQIMYSVLAEAVASEQVARRLAMKLASDNATEMVNLLTRQYNRARQALITKEIAEIIGGAEALK